MIRMPIHRQRRGWRRSVRRPRGLASALGVLVAALTLWAVPVTAEEVTLRAVSAFAEGTRFSLNYERFIEKVNAEGEGLVQINYIGGGGKVMSPFEMGNAVRAGVVHMASVAGAYYTNLMPEADALKLIEYTTAELRQNGAWDYIQRLHHEKLNAHYLARQGEGIPFHLYLTKPISGPDLSGLKIRVTPVYHAFFAEMGATPLRTPPGEVYTALQRGVVDGYGWASQGVLDLGWHEVTGYRVDPGFYNVDIAVLVNLDTWEGLSDAQRAFLVEQGRWLESLNAENDRLNAEEFRQQAAAGIETITFSDAETARYLQMAYDAGWARVLEVSPQHGPRLKELFTRPE